MQTSQETGKWIENNTNINQVSHINVSTSLEYLMHLTHFYTFHILSRHYKNQQFSSLTKQVPPQKITYFLFVLICSLSTLSDISSDETKHNMIYHLLKEVPAEPTK